jgi:hypothetical protein
MISLAKDMPATLGKFGCEWAKRACKLHCQSAKNCILREQGKRRSVSGTSSDGAVSLDQSFIQIPYESTMKIEHPRDSYGEHLPFLCNKDIKWVFHDEMHAFFV